MNGEKANSKILFLIIASVVILVCALYFSLSKGSRIIVVKEEKEVKPESTSVLFVGDIMLDRNVRNIIDKKGFDYFFRGVKYLVKDVDIAVGNLEGPFTDYPSITKDLRNQVLKFTFDPNLAPALADIGFDVLGLANNHSLNFGSAGLEMTKRFIGQSGMAYYGDPNNSNEISTVIISSGIKVGLVGFHEFTYKNFDKIFSEIEKLRPEVDVLIVTPHWGVEYKKNPTDKQKEWARGFIDSGADAVIGSHSHIVGEIEEYNGKKIFYSLGNFAFDQYFSEDTMNGLTVQMNIEKINENVTIEYSMMPIRTDKDGTTATALR